MGAERPPTAPQPTQGPSDFESKEAAALKKKQQRQLALKMAQLEDEKEEAELQLKQE